MRYATRESGPASAPVEAADTLGEGFEATAHPQRVCDHWVGVLHARAAGVMLLDGGRAVSPDASSRYERLGLDLLEAQHDGGPCRESYDTGSPVPPVSVRVAHAAARRPDFTERALGYDIVTTFAVPVRRRGQLLGALNVFVTTLPGAGPPAADAVPRSRWLRYSPTPPRSASRTVTPTPDTARCPGSCRRPCRAGSGSSRPRGCSRRAGGGAGRPGLRRAAAARAAAPARRGRGGEHGHRGHRDDDEPRREIGEGGPEGPG